MNLQNLSKIEWENLCDGCGRCCLHKFEDEHKKVYFTDVACKYLNNETCECSDYKNRSKLVPTCLNIEANWGEKFNWLPKTCSYRLLNKNKALPEWHHLNTGDKNSVHLAGISVRNRVYNDKEIKDQDFFKHIINWVE